MKIKKNGNPWGVSFKQGLFNMTSDSHLFKTKDQLEEMGFEIQGNWFVKLDEVYLPLYEAKMFKQYDHRFGSYENIHSRRNTNLKSTDISKYKNKYYDVIPWYWVSEKYVDQKSKSNHRWFFVFRDIARSTDERTGISSIIPYSGVSNKAPLMSFKSKNVIYQNILLSNLNSIVFDYVVRNKIGGTSLNYFIIKQLPVIPPSNYNNRLIDEIAPNPIELTYTAWDLKPFAEDVLDEIGEEKWNEWFPHNPVVDGVPQPFIWDEERRFQLKCELDAIYAHLYGISKDDLDYILDTFPIVKRKDEKEYGNYRTKDTIMEYYDKYQGVIEPVQGE